MREGNAAQNEGRLFTVTRSDFELPYKCDATIEKHVDKGWCYSELDFFVGETDDPMSCWEMCEREFNYTLVASDLWAATDECFCQDACDCMASEEEQVYMVTREAVTDLPGNCDISHIKSRKYHIVPDSLDI